MPTVDPAKIELRDRQRKDFAKEPLAGLRDSILARGLLHAPVVYFEGATPVLIAGERRLRAIAMIHESGAFFSYGGVAFPPGECPVVALSDPTPENIAAAEAEENLMREDLTWIEETKALARIQEIRAAQGQTATATAAELRAKTNSNRAVATLQTALSQAKVVAAHLNDPEIAKSRNRTEAYQRIITREQNAVHAALRAATPSTEQTWKLLKGDALTLMPELPDGQFDLILVDPPYGQGAHTGGYRSRSPLAHEYKDTPEVAKEILQAILLEGFRVTKPRANLLAFFNIDNWSWLCDAATRAAWLPFVCPIIWHKSALEGMAPWGANGPVRSYECIFFATKGQRGTLHPLPDVIYEPKVPRAKRVFAAQKPFNLLARLIRATTIEGDSILDPCAGSGSTLRAARLLNRPSLGIEKDENTFNTAMRFIESEQEESDVAEGQTTTDDL